TKPILRRGLLQIARTYLAPGDGRPVVSALAGDAEIARQLDGFVDRLGERMGAMERALDARDLDTVAGLAHQLKGVAGGYGFPTTTDAAAPLGACARAAGGVSRAPAARAAFCRRAAARPAL